MAIPGMGNQTISATFVARDQMSKSVATMRKNIASLGGPKFGPIGNLISGMAMMPTPALAAAAGIGAMVTVGADAIRQASDLAESATKVGVVFGKEADRVMEFGNTTARSMGISERAALSATGTLGNLFDALDQGDKAAADMSIGLVKLAGDLASFNNTDIQEVLTALQSGIVGETEPVRRLGINLLAVRVNAKAVAMGLAESTKSVSQAAKVQARYALIMEDTKNAQGDFARTQDGLANTTRILNAELDDATTALGTALLPTVKEVAQGLVKLADGLGEVGTAANDLNRFLSLGFTAEVQDVGAAMRAWSIETGMSMEAINAAVTSLGPNLGRGVEAFNSYKDAIIEAVTDAENETTIRTRNMALSTVQAVEDGAPEMAAAAKDLYDPVVTQARWASLRATHYMTEMPQFAVSGIRSQMGDIRSVMMEFKHNLTDPISEAEEIAFIEAKLASKAVRRGMNSQNPQIKADARALVAWLKTKLAELNGIDISISAHTTQIRNLKSRGGRYSGDSGAASPGTRQSSGAAAQTINVNVVSVLDGEKVSKAMDRRNGRKRSLLPGD